MRSTKFFRRMVIIMDIILISATLQAQNKQFNHQDSLRGSITKERRWWDLKFYHLDIRINPNDSTIHGQNTIRYLVVSPYQIMQIDLQKPLKITKVTQDSIPLDILRDGNAWFVKLKKKQKTGALNQILVEYEGKPVVSKNPPWSGGLSWRKDSHGKNFIATTCQGDGASIWWPCKDHQYDEPDSMKISLTIPKGLTGVSNGRLLKKFDENDSLTTFEWMVCNPINNYGVNANIADYVNFSDTYKGLNGDLTCNYYVLKENLEKAKVQFMEVNRMLEAFENLFGPYPFYQDGYKLVEVPYPGMEHQSSVTYGNMYKNGFGGFDLSRTGWGMKFDFIIVHESAHEWFGNNITYKDIADMWIHESFAAYAECLFVEYWYGKQAGYEYVKGTRANIINKKPVIGIYNINFRSPDNDMYYKGANMLHTLRQLVEDDKKWNSILKGLNRDFYHQTVATEQIENYISDSLCFDLKPFFNQYLRNTKIPVFEYSVIDSLLEYNWENCVSGFDFPLKIKLNGQEKWISPTQKRKEMVIEKGAKIEVDPNFYITTKELKKEN